MDQPNQQEIGAAGVAGAANIDQPGQDKLNADCWEKVFDCLSFEEIYNMSQTCKRLQRIAGFYGKQYLPAVCGKIDSYARYARARKSTGGVPLTWYNSVIYGDGLNEYINELHIKGQSGVCSTAGFKLNHCLCAGLFPSVKRLKLSDVKMTEPEFRYIEGILGKIEALVIVECQINGDLFVRILQHCTKLKDLRVERSDLGTRWLRNEYPTLENLEFKLATIIINIAGAKMVSFLTNNPNVKRFQIEADFIWENRQAFKEADIQLDCLDIDFNDVPTGPFVRLLEELHGRRFYKSLHIHPGWQYTQEFINSVAPLSTLNALNTGQIWDIDLSSLVHLRELRCDSFNDTMDLEALAKKLLNLEQLSISRASMSDVLPFVRHSKKLYKIRINRFDVMTLRRDLTSLNNERHKLKDELHGRSPKIVIVQLCDWDYMSCKWHANNVSLDLIELKRSEMNLQIDRVPYDIPNKKRK